MQRQIKFIIVAATVGLSMSACVSTGTFDKMEADKNREIKSLQQQQSTLEQNKAALEKQLLLNDQQNKALVEQTKVLVEQKGELLSASQQQQQQYDALVKKLSSEVEKGQLKVQGTPISEYALSGSRRANILRLRSVHVERQWQGRDENSR